MAPVGRRKSSIPSPGGPAGNGGGIGGGGGGGGVADDIAHLSLGEVQARLERNARVLGLALFSPSTSPLSPGPLAGPFPPSTPTAQARAGAVAAAGGSGAVDPVREKLLLARQALLDRQSELLLQSAQNGLSAIHVDPSLDPPSHVGGLPVAGPSKSGSQRALEEIRMRDRDLAPRSRMIPIDEAQSLAERDHDDATARRISALTLDPESAQASTTGARRIPRRTLAGGPGLLGGGGGGGGGRRGLEDDYTRAQAAARLRAFMSANTSTAEDEFFFDVDDDDFTPRGEYARPDKGDREGIVSDEVEGEYAEDMLDTGRDGRAEGERVYRTVGAGEEVDAYGEDDEMWPEGNDDDVPEPRVS